MLRTTMLAAVAAMAACAGAPKQPEIENRMPDGSPCITLGLSLTCVNSTIEGQCTVAVHNRSGHVAVVHRDFAVGDQYENSKWRNLYFRVVDIKGYAYRMNARFPPSKVLGESVMALEPTHGKQATYDVAVLHHRVGRFGNVIPLPFGDYKITAHYDVSQINVPAEMPFCKDVFASNRVQVEILGPNDVMSPGFKPNRFESGPASANPVDGTRLGPDGPPYY